MAVVCLPEEMLSIMEFDLRIMEIEDIYKEKYSERKIFSFDKDPPAQQLPQEFKTDPALKWRWEGIVSLYTEKPREFKWNIGHPAETDEFVLLPDLFPAVDEEPLPLQPQPKADQAASPIVEDCVICASGYEEGEEKVALVLLCGHYFHWSCMTRWMQESQTCPYCRTSVEPAGSIEKCSSRVAAAYTVPIGQAKNDLLLMQYIANEDEQELEVPRPRSRRRRYRHQPY